jgi:hypothetical protein
LLHNTANGHEWRISAGGNLLLQHVGNGTTGLSISPAGDVAAPQLVNCAGLQTDGSGTISCAAGPTPPAPFASSRSSAGLRAGTSGSITSARRWSNQQALARRRAAPHPARLRRPIPAPPATWPVVGA